MQKVAQGSWPALPPGWPDSKGGWQDGDELPGWLVSDQKLYLWMKTVVVPGVLKAGPRKRKYDED